MDQTHQFWMTWSVYSVSALATLLAVIVALFGDYIRGYLFPPKLTVHLVSPVGLYTLANVGPDANTHVAQVGTRYYHMEVQNGRTWRPATQAAIYLVRLDAPGPDGELKTKWSGALLMKWPFAEHLELPLLRTIGPPQVCDLCYVVEGKGLRIDPVVTPLSLYPHIANLPFGKPVNLTVYFQARSVEGNSPVVGFKITWDGQWHDGDQEMAHHLIVKQS